MKYLLGGLALLGLCATQAAAETWHPYSRSTGSVFMADVDSIVVEGEITRVLVATVARTGDAGAPDRRNVLQETIPERRVAARQTPGTRPPRGGTGTTRDT